MSIKSGFYNGQVDADKNTKRFKYNYHSKSRKMADSRAENLRKKGKNARVVVEGENYVVYVRG